MSRFARQRDANEPEIIRVLRAAGASVTPLNGTGVPDLLVGFEGRTFLIEVKNRQSGGGGSARPGNGGDGVKTPGQVDWWEKWEGAAPVIVFDADEALAAINCWVDDAKAPESSWFRRRATAADFPVQKRSRK